MTVFYKFTKNFWIQMLLLSLNKNIYNNGKELAIHSNITNCNHNPLKYRSFSLILESQNSSDE